jgi:hypothetical protein
MIPILEILTFVRVRSVPARSATSRCSDGPNGRQELQGDEAAQPRVSSPVDHPMPPWPSRSRISKCEIVWLQRYW